MTPAKYLIESERTEYTPSFVYAGIGTDQSSAETLRLSQLMHAAMGMVTEAGEFIEALYDPEKIDVTNLIEETGDVLWYVALACRALGTSFEELGRRLAIEDTIDPFKGDAPFTVHMRAGLGFVTTAAEFIDVLKKLTIYSKPINTEKLIDLLSRVMWCALVVCVELDVSIEHVMDRNIEKLRKRYPEKFTSENAINRNLEAEREALEGK